MGDHSKEAHDRAQAIAEREEQRRARIAADHEAEGDAFRENTARLKSLRLTKEAAYLAYVTQLLRMIGWEAPEPSAAAVLGFETAIAEVSWSNAERRDPEKTYNPIP